MKKKLLVFCHNLERNGSNHFLFTLCEALINDFDITLSSPCRGPLAEDYEQNGIKVLYHDLTKTSGVQDVQRVANNADFGLVNTMIRCDGVLACRKAGKNTYG